MPGAHQLQNAATATCVALCLRNLGTHFLTYAWPLTFLFL